ncbi:MAG TPA: ABC transporter ATP-binding protein, partial [Tianweitania sediminis]|nr:ABC transporter ATP-binding protein [Tianweitania sediminis]
MILRTKDLGWSVRGKAIVSGVDLAINEGETLGLIGPNGSGKSTLLKLLGGIRQPTRGAVSLQGRDIASMPRRKVAQIIAFLEQQAETTEAITVRDAVELGRTPWLGPLQPWSPEDDRIVADALRDTDMTGF